MRFLGSNIMLSSPKLCTIADIIRVVSYSMNPM